MANLVVAMLMTFLLSTQAQNSSTFPPLSIESTEKSSGTTNSEDFMKTNNTLDIAEDFTTKPNNAKVSTSAADISLFSSTSSTLEVESTTLSVLQKWKNFENITKLFAKKSVKALLPGLMEGTGKMNISASCMRDVLKLIVGLRDIKTWAFSFIDASGKFITGMLGGTLSNLGEYDQCVDIKATDDRKGRNYGKVMFTGQYCALDIKPPLPSAQRYYKLNDVVDELKNFSKGGNIINEAAKTAQFFHFLAMRIGLCVPSGCQASDIEEVAKKFTENLHWTVKVKRCEVKEGYEYTPLIISVMTVFCFFGFLMLMGSLLELYHYCGQKKIESTPLQVLACFSLISNFKKLANTKTSAGSMNCLHGLRFLSISWIILGHTYLNVNFQIFRGLRKATIMQRDFFFQAVVNASVAVDTFFFIGGLLVCYATIKIVQETKKPFNIPLYLMHRLFRILPVYIFVILFIYLAPILGSGPIWHDSIDTFVDACYKNWWTNILFINNFVHAHEMCLPQSWYIACDIQLYIAALIVLLPLLRWPRVGLSIAWMGVLASMIGAAVMTYIYQYPPTMLFVHPDPDQRIAYWANAYFKPYSHAGPYCIGLVIGYLLATRSDLKFSLPTRFIGWCSAIACNLAVLYGVYSWNVGRDPELVETLLYSGCHRVAWTFGLAWVVVNCATGQGGVVNYILSWKCWVPLGRLTYAAYLIHPIVQIAALGNARMNVQTTHYFAVWIFFGHLLITYGSSFAASMLVEAPFIGLEKILLKRISRMMDSNDKKLTCPEEDTVKRNDGHSHENEHDTNGFIAHL